MSIKILKFNLSGQFAFFKNPEVNSNYYFTFNNINSFIRYFRLYTWIEGI